jgi:hypothetical protein
MSLVKISGIGGSVSDVITYPIGAKSVTVSKEKAWSNFVVMVNLNLFSLKELLLSNPNVTYGSLRQSIIDNGFDFNTLDLILTAK